MKNRLQFKEVNTRLQNRVVHVYNSLQPAKFAGFSARFHRLLSLLQKPRYVKEMMFIRSHNRLLFKTLATSKLTENAAKKLNIVYHLTLELNWEPSSLLIQPVVEVEIQLEKVHTGSQ